MTSEPLQEADRRPDNSTNYDPPVDTTQPGVDLEVDVSHLYFPITILSMN
jgi:hypothetical protein